MKFLWDDEVKEGQTAKIFGVTPPTPGRLRRRQRRVNSLLTQGED